MIVIYAPNIHTGGGYVLLQELIFAWPNDVPVLAFMDGRIKGNLRLPASFGEVYWVFPSVWSRLLSEYRLWKVCSNTDLIFCCNGLPPLLPSTAKVISNLQNINYLKNDSSIKFSKRVGIRLFFEKFVFKFFNNRIDHFFVQTQTMKYELERWRNANQIKSPLDCIIFPYSKALPLAARSDVSKAVKEWDFIYVSDGVAHKNHQTLFEAWVLLAEDGIFPTLAVTLSSRDSEVEGRMINLCATSGAKIYNIGYIKHDKVLDLYGKAKALIFPSLRESFGLPLVEASFFKLPILAPELDYVRDICAPTQTFDPTSSLSIARAVKRFLEVENINNQIHSASEFIEKLLERS